MRLASITNAAYIANVAYITNVAMTTPRKPAMSAAQSSTSLRSVVMAIAGSCALADKSAKKKAAQ